MVTSPACLLLAVEQFLSTGITTCQLTVINRRPLYRRVWTPCVPTKYGQLAQSELMSPEVEWSPEKLYAPDNARSAPQDHRSVPRSPALLGGTAARRQAAVLLAAVPMAGSATCTAAQRRHTGAVPSIFLVCCEQTPSPLHGDSRGGGVRPWGVQVQVDSAGKSGLLEGVAELSYTEMPCGDANHTADVAWRVQHGRGEATVQRHEVRKSPPLSLSLSPPPQRATSPGAHRPGHGLQSVRKGSIWRLLARGMACAGADPVTRVCLTCRRRRARAL